MANNKRDWQRLARQSQRQKDIRDDYLSRRYELLSRSGDTWPIGKKHLGKHISTLPTDYIIWISENLRPGNKGILLKAKGMAEQEIIRRYQANNQHKRLAGQT